MIKSGGPAFPIIIPDAQIHLQGMSLRDYFAAKALMGQIASISDPKTVQALGLKDKPEHFFEWAAVSAYKFADAMLKEREK